ncbi:MAG TPA: 3'-5' exonuclease [Gemmatimonadaceae bacterium]|nr:3'-5' exonuclease [Gemmatimonadaceae bacterium]
MNDAQRDGIRLRPEEGVLMQRARQFLRTGASPSAPLIAHVCQLPDPPPAVAEHLAVTLLAGCDDVRRLADGRWELRAAPALVREEPSPLSPSTTETPSLAREELPPPFGQPHVTTRRPRIGSTRGSIESTADAQPLCEQSWLVVDVETTGTSPNGGDRVTEVAAVLVRGGKVEPVFQSLVNPERAIPMFVSGLTGITQAMVRNAPTFREIAPALADVMRGHVFVAHNVMFDWRFLSAEFARCTGEILDGRRLCTVRLARRLLPQLPRRSLDHVADYYGVDIADRHRAAGDALATAHVLLGLLRDAESRDVTTWGALEALTRKGTGAARRARRTALPHPVTKDTTA